MTAFRKLRAGERREIEAHFLRLDDEDRRLRFGGLHVKPRALAAYLQAIDWTRSVMIGAFVDGTLRGVAQIAVAKGSALAALPALWPRADGAEFAVSVERGWQRQGLGRRLLAQAIVVARNRRVPALFMYCVPENERMRRLAARAGVRLAIEEGTVVGRVDLPAPDQTTVLAEIANEAAGAFDGWVDAVIGPRRRAA
jgi:GNAT superfamily N-acetyltransferase